MSTMPLMAIPLRWSSRKSLNRNKGTAAEAKIIDILEHSLTTVVGQIVLDQEKPKYAGYIRSKESENQPTDLCEETGYRWKVLKFSVFIDKYPSKKHDFFVASVLDVVGHSTDAGMTF